MEIAPNIAVLGFTAKRIAKPTAVKTKPRSNAFCFEINPAGNGRFLVLSIKASKSFSIT